MKFPDTVTILRATGTDAYGNPANDWTAPAETTAQGFLLDRALFLDRSADVRPRDRVRVGSKLFAVEGAPLMLRSPNREVMWALSLERIPDGA